MDEMTATDQLQNLWPNWLESRERSKEWEKWAQGKQELPAVPETATAEYVALQQKAITPWLGLVVQSLAQALDVEGFSREDEDDRLWRVWQANQMDRRQQSLYEAAITTGIAYVAVLRTNGNPEWRMHSSATMCAFYEQPDDDYPTYAVSAVPKPAWKKTRGWDVVLYDNRNVYLFDQTETNQPTLKENGIREHGLNVTPVVRYVNRLTVSGRAIGEVEPYTATAARIDQDVFDRLIVQRFGAWRTRTATGLVAPDTEAAQNKQDLQLKVSDILTSTSVDTKFGSLPETQLDGHLRAPIDSIKMLASVTQTPPQLLTSDISNISAEALVAIEASYNRKVEQRKRTFGESHEQSFNLSAQLVGVPVDPMSQVKWRDMESRSLSQTADAYGKLATSLSIPPQVLWDKIPVLTDQDRKKAKQLLEEGDALARLFIETANTPVV